MTRRDLGQTQSSQESSRKEVNRKVPVQCALLESCGFFNVVPEYFGEFCSPNSVSENRSMNRGEIGYSWFKILAGYSENNSKKGNFL